MARVRSSRHRAGILAAAAVLLAVAACRRDKGEGELHARLSALERETDGLRASVQKLERGEPILPPDAVAIGISQSVVKDFLTAQLPFEADADKFRVKLTQGEATFLGSPAVNLTGSIWPAERPNLVGEVRVQGALEGIQVDPEKGTLRATLALDHVDLVQMGGLENYLPAGSLNELARRIRKALEDRIPPFQIPVTIEQGVDLPSVTDGPVRIQGAHMPLEVGVVDVFTGRGNLWIAVKVVPGELTRTTDKTPAKADSPPPTARPKAAKPPSPAASPKASPGSGDAR